MSSMILCANVPPTQPQRAHATAASKPPAAPRRRSTLLGMVAAPAALLTQTPPCAWGGVLLAVELGDGAALPPLQAGAALYVTLSQASGPFSARPPVLAVQRTAGLQASSFPLLCRARAPGPARAQPSAALPCRGAPAGRSGRSWMAAACPRTPVRPVAPR